jgi:hypothetical protein
MYLVPPMAEEPPREFVDFVARHLRTAQQEAARLTGGPQHADEIYPMALSDVAGHWRRLRWRARMAGHDTTADFLARCLTRRAKRWREEQIYEVEVSLLRPPVITAAFTAESYAARLAALIPGTIREQHRPSAEAAIAWTYAWRRARWHRIYRTVTTIVIVLIVFLQTVSSLQATID